MQALHSRRDFIRKTTLGALGLGLGAGLSRAQSQQQQAPNIIFLLTDDQRWDALGCAGNPLIQTPHLDALAAEGVRFGNAFATTAICCSSRAGIFTGLHTCCHGIVGFQEPLNDFCREISYPRQLGAAGYYTGFVGKYGVGGAMPKEDFDYFMGFPGQGKYFPEGEDSPVHLTAQLGDQALDFLRQCKSDTPFCLSVSFKAPHVQDQDPRQYLYDPKLEGLYQDETIPKPDKGSPEDFEALPDFLKSSEGRVRWERRFATEEMYQRSVKGYYRLISGVDKVVGRIREQLQAQGLDQNTILVFAADQGIFLGERGLAGKWFQHEESIRMPLIIADPRLPKQDQGKCCEAMALNIDIAPTLLDFAGVAAPACMQGRSLRPWVTGEQPVWRKEVFCEHHFKHDRIPPSEGLRTAADKYIVYTESDPIYEEYYDLASDPLEHQNRIAAADCAGQVEALRGRIQIWRNALKAWKAEKDYAWQDPA